MNKMLLNIKLRYDNCLCKKVDKLSDKFVLQDIIVNHIGNYYLIDRIEYHIR